MDENITPLAEIIIFIVVQCFPKLTYIKHMFSSQQINHRDGAPDVAVYLPKPPNMTTPRASVALVFGVCPAPLAFGFPFWITNTDHLHLVLRRGSSSHTGAHHVQTGWLSAEVFTRFSSAAFLDFYRVTLSTSSESPISNSSAGNYLITTNLLEM